MASATRSTGARSDLAPAPSVDIANGAPTGADATNRIVMSFVSGDIAAPHVFFTESTDGGTTWAAPRAIEGAGDRGFYTAPFDLAITTATARVSNRKWRAMVGTTRGSWAARRRRSGRAARP